MDCGGLPSQVPNAEELKVRGYRGHVALDYGDVHRLGPGRLLLRPW